MIKIGEFDKPPWINSEPRYNLAGPVSCTKCCDLGWVYDSWVRASRQCDCRRERIFAAKMRVIPPEFRYADLSTLKPDPAKHEDQAGFIELIQEHPTESFLFCGKNGAGKSHFSWALYREACFREQKSVAMPTSLLMEEWRRWEISKSDDWQPQITPAKLRQTVDRYCIFLDEFDKLRVSEFASEKMFEFMDAALGYQHQLICTSNMPIHELRTYWSEQGSVWGASIVRRLQDLCVLVEMF